MRSGRLSTGQRREAEGVGKGKKGKRRERGERGERGKREKE
jgi:hypothetical protein